MTTSNYNNITLGTIWDRTAQTIEEAIQADDVTLVDAPPGSGKTTSLPKIVGQTNRPVTYLAQRTDLYEQMEKLCANTTLSYQTIPSPHRVCPTFNGSNGAAKQQEVNELYQAGVSGRRIHQELNLPCLPNCTYVKTWEAIDSGQPDVLIGNTHHAYVESVIEDRVVVIDEFPGDAFITHFKNPETLISTFLQDNPSLGYSDYTDFLQRKDKSRLMWSHINGSVDFDPCPETVLQASGSLTDVDSRAGLLTYGVASMVDLGNGFESTTQYVEDTTTGYYVPRTQPWDELILGNRTLVRNRNKGEIRLLTPPDLSQARSIVALDGTPTMTMWNTVLDEIFRKESVLAKSDWKGYLNAVNIEILQTNNSPKPYYNPNNVSAQKDTSIAFWIRVNENEKPGLITSKKALQKHEEYNNGEIFNHVSDSLNFGSVRSYNGFKDKSLGYVSGSRHYGDDHIKRWGALMGHAIKGKRKGHDRIYGDIGNQIRDQMRIETLQDVLRFGRGNNDPTRVYVNTSVLPDWIPKQRVYGTVHSKKERQMIEFMRNHPDQIVTVREAAQKMNCTTRCARGILNALTDEGYLTKTKKKGYGTNGKNHYKWR